MIKEEIVGEHPDNQTYLANHEESLIAICKAINDFLREDKDLLTKDANERSISHKLAEHLQKYFEDLKVDCEYNRHHDAVKRLTFSRETDIRPTDLDAKTVYPDIVIHKRGVDSSNFVVIEIKKSNSTHKSADDKRKLCNFTGDEYKYQLGVFLVADVTGRCLKIWRIFRLGRDITREMSATLEDLCHEL